MAGKQRGKRRLTSDMTGEELRARRQSLDLTQVQLGRVIGRHPITISDYERGVEPIPPIVARLVRSLR